MKRAVIVSLLVLELALVALVVWSGLRAKAPQPAPGQADPAGRTSQASPMRQVRVRVAFARTQAPVQDLEAELEYRAPSDERAPGVCGAILRGNGQEQLVFDVPVGARLQAIEVSPRLVPGDPQSLAASFVPRRKDLELSVGEESIDLRVEVDPPRVLTGLVRDARSREPLQDAKVVVAAGTLVRAEALTDAEGRFVLEGLLPELGGRDLELHTEREGFLSRRGTQPRDGLLPDAAETSIELEHGLVVSGSVVDEDGRPLPGVSLQWRAAGVAAEVELADCVRRAVTDASGRFRLETLPPCAALLVDVPSLSREGREFLAVQRDLGPLGEDREGLRIALPRAGLLEVQARFADGSILEPREFTVLCPGSPGVEPAGQGAKGKLVRVPLGEELELVAYARSRDTRAPDAYFRGSARTRLEPGEPVPRPLPILLGVLFEPQPPPARPGVREIALPFDDLRATTDVQLLDALTGRPLRAGARVSVAGAGRHLMTNQLEQGWLRVSGRPGRQVFEVGVEDGPPERMELMLALGVYRTAEWSLGTGR